MIGIIDYGMGNIASVRNAVEKLGYDCLVSSEAAVLQACDKLILPGVGAFKDMMDNIKKADLFEPVKTMVQQDKKPLLGICLGMQALFESSEEKGITEGFGFIKGKIVLMSEEGLRVPHIGFNRLEKNNENKLWDVISDNTYVYYVHSYYASDYDDEDLIAYSTYGNLKVAGVVMKDNVMGTQFHPEKSGEDGLKILKYFLEEFE